MNITNSDSGRSSYRMIIIFYPSLYTSINLILKWGVSMVNSNIIVSKFDLLLPDNIYLKTNSLRKGMNLVIP